VIAQELKARVDASQSQHKEMLRRAQEIVTEAEDRSSNLEGRAERAEARAQKAEVQLKEANAEIRRVSAEFKVIFLKMAPCCASSQTPPLASTTVDMAEKQL